MVGLQIGGTRQGEMWASAWQESGCIIATENDPEKDARNTPESARLTTSMASKLGFSAKLPLPPQKT
jgi:hypothetical protein